METASLAEIIRIQSEIIDGLFARLTQSIPAEELGKLPELDMIKTVVDLREETKECNL